MSQYEVVMPQMGESITNGTITKWHKSPGDKVELDEVLLEISTDKVESEIPSPAEGRVWKLFYNEGDTVDVGVKIALIEEDLEKAFDGGAEAEEKPSVEVPASPPPEKVEAQTPAPTHSTTEGRRFYTPLVKALARDHGVDLRELESIPGSGAGGRVNRSDFEKYLSQRGKKETSFSQISPGTPTPPPVPSGERVEVIPMDSMRKTIAKNMVASKLTSPHVNSLDEINMTHLVRFREGFKQEFKRQEGFSLTYTHFILYALVQALKKHPLVNASVEGDNIILKKDIHLGCAVAVPGNGLVVPVIKNADGLNITGLARTVNDLASKARQKKLTLDELSGGTFTFTNVGSFGTLMATPVILQPQVGIFACGVIKKRPIVVEGDALAVASMMYATHTYDHRLVDGELGGRFLASVKDILETMVPESLF